MKRATPFMAFLVLSLTVLNAQSVNSLYSDIKAHQVGDVLSVIISENANALRESKSSSSSNTDMSIGAESKGNIANFIPVFGGSGKIASDYKGQDGNEQRDRLTGRITVRIVEKTDNGMFRIKGERKIGVNGDANFMRLEGFIRPRDITAENTIFSYNVADAKITYRRSGIANSIFPPGTFPKLFTWLLGGLMVAASAGYFAFK